MRHEWIDVLCGRLHRMAVGDAAGALLAADGDVGPLTAVLVAPTWVWRSSHIDIGRKGRRPDGAPMLMPVRADWDEGPVRLVGPGGNARFRWALSGLGHTGTGDVTVAISPEGMPVAIAGSAPDDAVPSVAGHGRSELRALAADGKAARWEALMSLEGYVDRAVMRAVSTVTADIYPPERSTSRPGAVLDDTSRQQVRDKMMLGTEGDSAYVLRLLDRCLRPCTFAKVDPLRFIVSDLCRTAEEEVRRAVDDPKVGRKVRTLRRTLPDATLPQFLDTYRGLHPSDSLSWRRVERALTSGHDPMAGAVTLDENTPAAAVTDDLADTVAAMVDLERCAGAA
jgi:hypothetical protein